MKKLTLLTLFISMLISLSTQADKTTAKIERILLVESSNLIYIYPVGGVQNPPACHGSNGNYISYKMSRPMAKEYLSLLMTAFVAKKTVTFRTAGACTDQSVSDTLFYFSVAD